MALPNNERLTRSSPNSLSATLAAQPSMSLVPLASFLDFTRNDRQLISSTNLPPFNKKKLSG